MFDCLQKGGLGLEHHLHRGRALAAFNHLLAVRVQKLKMESTHRSPEGQTNVQADVQTVLAPVTQSEESLLSSVWSLFILIYLFRCMFCLFFLVQLCFAYINAHGCTLCIFLDYLFMHVIC